MSGKPALIREADVARIVKGYAKLGISVGMTVRNGAPVFLPVDLLTAGEPSASNEDDALDRELAEFVERHGDGRA